MARRTLIPPSRGRSRVLPWLLATLALPGTLFYFGLTSSLALGTTVVAFALAVGALVHGDRPAVQLAMRNAAVITLLLLLALTAHLMVAATRLQVDMVRAMISLVPVTVLLMGSMAMAQRLVSAAPDALDRSMRRCALALVVVAVLGGLGVAPPTGQSFVKPMFPYSEPSHFALVFAPLLIYNATTTGGWRRLLWLGTGITLALWIENLTLVFAVTLATCMTLRVPMLLMFVSLLAALTTQLDLAYFTSRLLVSEDSDNLSVLVFIQGWELLADALNRSGGWGIGFQQMGLVWRDSPAADAIYAIVQDNLNVLDGGLTLVKLGGELGVFGLAVSGLLIALAVSSTMRLRWLALGLQSTTSPVAADVFARCVVVGFSIELLVRGLGYFTPTSLLLLASLWVLYGRRLGACSLLSARLPRQRAVPT